MLGNLVNRLILIFIFCVFTQSMYSQYLLGTSFLIGSHFRYGGSFKSLNQPKGIWALNSTTPSVPGKNFAESKGVTAELLVKFVYFNRLFISTGLAYTAGNKVTGQFPLRNPSDNSLYLLNGTDEVATTGSAKLTHYGVPTSAGLVMTYWNDLRIFLGLGISYVSANQTTSQASVNTDQIDFNLKFTAKSRFLTYNAVMMGEYVVIGTTEETTKLAINAGFKVFQGQSPSIVDSEEETNLLLVPLLAKDAGKVDLSGYAVFFGVTYYFLGL